MGKSQTLHDKKEKYINGTTVKPLLLESNTSLDKSKTLNRKKRAVGKDVKYLMTESNTIMYKNKTLLNKD